MPQVWRYGVKTLWVRHWKKNESFSRTINPHLSSIGGERLMNKWCAVAVGVGMFSPSQALHAAAETDSSRTNSSPPRLSLTIGCTNSDLKVGDEIPIQFIITNHGTNHYEYADRNYDRSGRMPEYALVAWTESGDRLPDPRSRYAGMAGGLFVTGHLLPGQSFTRTIPLNLWSLLKAPGKYTVIGYNSGRPYGNARQERMESAPISIAILPRTEKELDDYISSLTNQIAALAPMTNYYGRMASSPDLDGLVKNLMYTCSPKTVPLLIKTMFQPGLNHFWELQALLYYVPRSEETRRAIFQAAVERGLAPGLDYLLTEYGWTPEEIKPLIQRSLAPDSPQTWAEGARAAQHYGDDVFASRLIAIATDPEANARDGAIYALAANRTDESVKTLKSLLEDDDEKIRATARRAIRTAYLYRSIWRGTRLRPEDFDETFRQPGPP